MSVPNSPEWEIQEVKKLGEQIGYGNMMSIASALWRKLLRQKQHSDKGALVPMLMNKKSKRLVNELEIYDSLINNFDN